VSGIETAIAKAGDRRTFALSLNPPVTVQAVGQWIKRGWVPPQRALEIEKLYGIHRSLLVKPKLAVLVDDQHRSRPGQEVQS
jgi:hypothetical protein